MLEKLQIVKNRFDEVSDLIIQPDIITDQKCYVQLNKEYKDLKALMDKREEYITLTNNMKEAEEILSDGSDPEMVDMAKMQYEEAKSGLPKLEEDIKILLIPKDPEDGTKMWLWKSEPEQEGMRLVFLREIFLGCIPNIANLGDGVPM